uniref:carbonic anhydrase n=1 Tax=viral metagenome TaxID=1070528 RepID=A0A6C0ET12_9ZZZZ
MSCPNNEATKLKTQQEDKCKENCNFNFKYNSNSTCKLINKGDYLEIKTDGKNNVTYNSQGLSIDSVRLYIPSLHTFDGKHTEAELILKHSGGTKNFMICLPIKTNEGGGDSVNFFKQIASHIPLEKNNPTTVNVRNWSLNDVMPAPKTPFYHYIGDSPYPPCNMQATMIVFDNKHASVINASDLELIKKTIKPAAKTSKKEGFVGGFKEGFVAYNSNGANDTDNGSSSQAMECTEYYDTDPTSSGDDTSIKKPSIDWSKITNSSAFIIIIVLLSILAGGIFFYYVLWPMIRTRLDGVSAASESSLEIPQD